MAALPNGEAVLHFTNRGPFHHYTHRVVKITKDGQILHKLEHKIYDPDSKDACRGLLVLGEMLYVIKKTNSSVEGIRLSEFENGLNRQVDVYHIPDAQKVVNFASLFHDPFQIPDKDLLLLADREKGEIFTYRLSSGDKQVHVRDLVDPTSVSYILENNTIFYLVCDGMKGLTVYNSKWGLVKNIAKHWQRTLEEVRFSSAIALPDQNVLSADYKNNWVTEHTSWGMFVGYRIEKDNFQPMYLTFSHPYLWVLEYGNKLNRYQLYKD